MKVDNHQPYHVADSNSQYKTYGNITKVKTKQQTRASCGFSSADSNFVNAFVDCPLHDIQLDNSGRYEM